MQWHRTAPASGLACREDPVASGVRRRPTVLRRGGGGSDCGCLSRPRAHPFRADCCTASGQQPRRGQQQPGTARQGLPERPRCPRPPPRPAYADLEDTDRRADCLGPERLVPREPGMRAVGVLRCAVEDRSQSSRCDSHSGRRQGHRCAVRSDAGAYLACRGHVVAATNRSSSTPIRRGCCRRR